MLPSERLPPGRRSHHGRSPCAAQPGLVGWLSTHHGVVTLATSLDRLGVSRHQLYACFDATASCRRTSAASTDWLARRRTPEQAAALACAAGPDVVVSHISAGREWGLRRLGRRRPASTSRRRRPNHRLATRRRRPPIAPHRPRRRRRTARRHPPHQPAAHRVRSGRRPAATSGSSRSSSRSSTTARPRCPTLYRHGRPIAAAGTERLGPLRPGPREPAGVAEAGGLRSGAPGRAGDRSMPGSLGRCGSTPSACRAASTFRLDFYWPAECEALEVDHVTWHGGKLDLTADKRRDRLLRQRRHPHDPHHRRRRSADGCRPIVDDLRAILRSISMLRSVS